MIEKFYRAISAIALTASGTTNGKLTLASTLGFKVKMRVLLEDPVQEDIGLEVKRVNSETELEVGVIGAKITDRTDVSAYSATSTLRSALQKRPDIPLQEIERAVFEEEPTVALRVKPVDPFGDCFTTKNPFPVQLSDGSINIGTVNAELEVQLSHQDDVPDSGDIADSVQVGDGTEIMGVNPDGSINVKILGGGSPGILEVVINDFAEITSLAMATLTTINTYTVPVGKSANIQRIEATGNNIGTYTFEINSVVEGKMSTWFGTPLNVVWDFNGALKEGLPLIAGDVVRVRIIHSRSAVGDFAARIQVLEIG